MKILKFIFAITKKKQLITFSINSFISILIVVFYKIDIYYKAIKIFEKTEQISFFSYILNNFLNDLTVILILSLPFLFLSFTANKFKKTSKILSFTILSIYLFLFLFFTDFFRIYETPFHTDFINSQVTSGLTEILISAISELSLLLIIKSVILFSFLIFFSYLISKKNIIRSNKIKKFSQTYIIILAIGLMTIPFTEKNATTSTIEDISQNPISSFFINSENENNNFSKNENYKFKFKLNTNSLFSKKLYKRIDNIPRGKKYNIIFYFFESTPMKYFNKQINERYIMETWHKLQKNSFFATNHYANYPLSANAMLSVFTSSYDKCNKDLTIQKHSNIKIKSISEILKENNYKTCIIHPGDLRYAGQKRYLKNRKFDKIIDYNDLKNIEPYNYKVGWGLDERSMIKPTIDFIKKDRNKPFFITYLPVNPHHPYKIPSKKYQITGEIPKNLDFKEKNWLNYLNSLYYADAALGELITTLEKHGLMENTILFLFADHGEAFYQHVKNYNHPFFLYEENVHVPFLIYNKQFFKKPIIFNGITRHIDILPTVLDILKIKANNEIEGDSMLSPRKEKLALLHTYWKDDFMGIRDGKWKYITNMKTEKEELYNLNNDPHETKNISKNHQNICLKFKNKIFNSRLHKKEFYKRKLNLEK